MRKLVLLLILVLIAVPASAISPLGGYDGGEMMPNNPNGAGAFDMIFPVHDGDIGKSDSFARTGLSSILMKRPGATDNLVFFGFDTCDNPTDAQQYQCATQQNTYGALLVAGAITFTGYPAVTSTGHAPFLSVGNRLCEDPPANGSGCNLGSWDIGNRMIEIHIGPTGTLSVHAFGINGEKTCTGTCSASNVVPILSSTNPFWDWSLQVIQNSPSTANVTTKLRYQSYSTSPFADATIDCVCDYSDSNGMPSSRVHLYWDTTRAGGNNLSLPAYVDDIVWAMTDAIHASFLTPKRGYALFNSTSSSDSGSFATENVGAFTTFGGGTRPVQIRQNPFNDTRYLKAPSSCDFNSQTDDCVEVLTPTTNSFIADATGAPALAASYPGLTEGPLMLLQTHAFVVGTLSSSRPGSQVGVRDNGLPCTGGRISTNLTPQHFAYTMHRSDGVNDAIGQSTACNQNSDFKCGPDDDGTPCLGGVHDYAHQIKAQYEQISGDSSDFPLQLTEGYVTAWFDKGTVVPDTKTPTQTRTATNSPLPTKTFTITQTPLFSFTPTAIFTPTITKTATKTATSASTFTASPTFGPTIKLPSDPPVSVCRTQNCVLCAHSQTDLRIVVNQACNLSTVLCPTGATVIIDRSYNTVNTPSVATDTLQPTTAIGGLALCSNLTLKCADQQTIKFTGPGSGLHPIPGTTIHDVAVDGCIWNGSSIATGESVFDFFGVNNLTVRNAKITGTTPVAITYGGPSVSGVTIQNVTAESRPLDAGGLGFILENNRWGQPTPTP